MITIITLTLTIIMAILPTEIVALLEPLVVFGCTALVKWALPKIPPKKHHKIIYK